jgi:peroxiredoxin
VTVVSILPERRPYLQKMWQRHGHVIRLLCDMDSSYALELGLVVCIGDRLRELMIADGLDLAHFQGNDMWFLPIPATFLVGCDGRVRARYIDPDFRNRAEIEALLADIQWRAG